MLKSSDIKDCIFILFGTFIASLSVVLFFIPNNFTTGGTPGMAIVLHELTGFPISWIIIAINTPLLIWGTQYIGKKFAAKTILSIVLISVFIDGLAYYFSNYALTHDTFLAATFGGALIGLGVGLIIKGNSSAGGSTIIAKIAHKKSNIKPSTVILIVDSITILLSIYVFKDVEKALWSIVSIYVTVKFIDVVLTGTISTKVIHITTNKPKELSLAIASQLEEKGTVLQGTGLRSDQTKTILFMVIDVKKIGLLKTIIQETDDEAFMLVLEASEMLGRGH